MQVNGTNLGTNYKVGAILALFTATVPETIVNHEATRMNN